MNFDVLLKGREFFSTMALVRTGLFSTRSSVWKKIKSGDLQMIYTSKKSRVVTRESLIRYLKKINKERI